MEPIRWGILGTGHIAAKFAEGLSYLDEAELVAVGSRARETAEQFAERWEVARAHPSYEDLADDPEVDVVYVATPHPMHLRDSMLCLRGGKAVLCEKPLTVNARQAGKLIDCAREEGLFLMEAVWTRFLPAIVRLRELLAEGVIGQVRMVKADFCFRTGWNPEGRLLNAELAGGGLLDVGGYTLALASMIYGGPPEEVASLAHIGETGVDEQAAILIKHSGGRLGVLSCAVRTFVPHEAVIAGTDGYIRLHHPFWKTDRLTVVPSDGEQQEMELPYEGNGYQCEAAEVMQCLRAGMTESAVMPPSESLSIARTMDSVRQQWGLKYPFE